MTSNKLRFTANGKKRGLGTLRSVLDFFFPIGNYLRCEATTTANTKTKMVYREFFTFRAFAVHYFYAIVIHPYRNFLKNQEYLALRLGINSLSMNLGAIVFTTGDNSVGTSGVQSSFTITQVCTGTNRILFENGCNSTALDHVNTPTYNSISFQARIASAVNDMFSALYYLPNPASGSNNLTQTVTVAGVIDITAAAYSGATQSVVDGDYAVNTNTGTSGTASVAVTPLQDNAWVVGPIRMAVGGVAAGTNTIQRTAQSNNYGWYESSLNPISPASSTTIAATGGSVTWEAIVVAFGPFAAATATTPHIKGHGISH